MAEGAGPSRGEDLLSPNPSRGKKPPVTRRNIAGAASNTPTRQGGNPPKQHHGRSRIVERAHPMNGIDSIQPYGDTTHEGSASHIDVSGDRPDGTVAV